MVWQSYRIDVPNFRPIEHVRNYCKWVFVLRCCIHSLVLVRPQSTMNRLMVLEPKTLHQHTQLQITLIQSKSNSKIHRNVIRIMFFFLNGRKNELIVFYSDWNENILCFTKTLMVNGWNKCNSIEWFQHELLNETVMMKQESRTFYSESDMRSQWVASSVAPCISLICVCLLFFFFLSILTFGTSLVHCVLRTHPFIFGCFAEKVVSPCQYYVHIYTNVSTFVRSKLKRIS